MSQEKQRKAINNSCYCLFKLNCVCLISNVEEEINLLGKRGTYEVVNYQNIMYNSRNSTF